MQEINAIVCDDNEFFRKKIIKIVKEFFTNYKQYKIIIHEFEDYDDNFLKIIDDKNIRNKIYILDLITPHRSGVDIARIIREKDFESYLILITSFFEDNLKPVVSKMRNYLGYVSKDKNYKAELIDCFNYIIKNGFKITCFRIMSNNINFLVEIEDINYITINKKISTIYCQQKQLETNKPLSYFKMLGNDFIQNHKSCIVNKNNVEYFDISTRMIKFKNGDFLGFVSVRYAKELRQELTYKA